MDIGFVGGRVEIAQRLAQAGFRVVASGSTVDIAKALRAPRVVILDLADELAQILARGEHAVLACSALKDSYRKRLQRAGDVRIVYLKGDEATLSARLAARRHQYMPASLLPSQLATLEEPAYALDVDIREPVEVQVRRIREAFGL
jgi:carbohydrate kinase (thermoresistant glucokinase family)